MNRYKCLFLVVCVLLLFNCKQEPSIVFSDFSITTPINSVVSVNVLQAKGSAKITSQINDEIENLIISALNIAELKSVSLFSLEDAIGAFDNEYLDFQKNFPDIKQNWEAQIDGEVMWQSKEIASIAITTYINTGAAHGALKIYFLNLNLKTGEKIENKRLFKNVDKFKALVKPYLEKAIIKKGVSLDANKFVLPENMGYNSGGIVLLYNTNELASYTNDIIEFIIPFEEIQPYLVFNGF